MSHSSHINKTCAAFLLLVLLLCDTTMIRAQEVPRSGPEFPGGATTVTIPADADDFIRKGLFGNPAANLTPQGKNDFVFGRRLFMQQWLWAPGFSRELDGAGPLFNQHSCFDCHVRDGRGQPPVREDEVFTTMIMRISVPGSDEHGGPKPHPIYGGEINTRGVRKVKPEGRPVVRYRMITGRFDDGDEYELRAPTYQISELAYGPLGDDVMFSPRVAPVMIGLGLLEAVPEADIVARADETDSDGDGITGRANRVWDYVQGKETLGRLGWKAGQPHVHQQLASAFLHDMGLTTSLFPKENVSAKQMEAAAEPTGGSPEVSDLFLSKLVFYSQVIAVAQRRDMKDAQVLRGETIFDAIGCAKCHVPSLKTGDHALPELRNQIIHPYTDLLLHDMGEALADHRPEYQATGSEWRTPPLWSIGLTPLVNEHTFYLHDGRARNLEEAILWHGGEAQASQNGYRKLPKKDRQALLRFIESL